MYYKTVPSFLRILLSQYLTWEVKTNRKEIFLTFDDGPIPEITPWVLDQLDRVKARATFFCVGDNVRKYPQIFNEIRNRSHTIGNHSYNHLQAWRTSASSYLGNVQQCQDLVNGLFFRPPHGQLTPLLIKTLSREYRIIMWSLLSCDFDPKISPYKCLEIVLTHTKPGSIVVFHDSLKAWNRLEYALPRFLDHFTEQGFSFSAF
jgi:peptidoglycan-N-acetylglucosamine deacetylase